jgi:hypothetical protein
MQATHAWYGQFSTPLLWRIIYRHSSIGQVKSMKATGFNRWVEPFKEENPVISGKESAWFEQKSRQVFDGHKKFRRDLSKASHASFSLHSMFGLTGYRISGRLALG